MIYRDFHGMKLSALGMGTMRLPVIGGNDSEIDAAETKIMVDYAMQHGVNYYDTAWGYHGGNAEAAIGNALKGHKRENFYLADKFPGYDLSNMRKVEEIFEKQLEKCGVEYFDFYLFHNVCELNIDAYLNREYGILDYLLRQKSLGRIRHLGFSAHGSVDVIKRFLDAYGNSMEFCQLQLNYLDWSLQKASEKVALLNSKNIPIWVMEPLRGGRLAALSDKHEAQLKALRPDETIPAWAFRFLQSTCGVTMILSGMSNFQQLAANIETFSHDRPLNDAELWRLSLIAEEMTNEKILPCTGCHYCVSHCPQSLDIPRIISLYNEHRFTGGGFIAPMALNAIPEDKRPGACLGCKSCEKVCPQQIKISEVMKDFCKIL